LLEWEKDRQTGLCFINQTSNDTRSSLRLDRPDLESLLTQAMLFAGQCKKKGISLTPADLERRFPELVFPDHLLQNIIDGPEARTAKQMALTFYAEILGRPESSISRDLFR